MIKFELHQREHKIRLIKKIREDFIKDFNVDPGEGKGFSRSEYVHFCVVDNKKYVHKESLRFALTNGGSYYIGVEALEFFKINDNAQEVALIDKGIDDLFSYYKTRLNDYKVFPTFLGESEHFFIFEYYLLEEWEELEKLELADAKYIRSCLEPIYKKDKKIVSLFHNQMYKKILKHKETGEIKIRDIKNLEFRAPAPLGIFFYNGYYNFYYQLEWRLRSRDYILKEYKVDYPTKLTKIVKLY